ncbi:hypothetical protein T4D_9106 [Trichinella pseudospiralis]|uniref:Uncharacterized protein n=1 Tax=Trichinella pseudospiralis TaxID=6337 RepID=A0A0V1FK82_TRIPS|nr:hypothetical protein T4D_9106 [Trichinella pseudospiralis]
MNRLGLLNKQTTQSIGVIFSRNATITQAISRAEGHNERSPVYVPHALGNSGTIPNQRRCINPWKIISF